jgi:hypothetical protein
VITWEAGFAQAVQFLTSGQLDQAGFSDSATAMRIAGQYSLMAQAQALPSEVPEQDQSCLFLNDRSLTQLRSMMQAEPDMNEKSKSFDDNIVMNIPGVGIYRGRSSVVEYTRISDYRYNDFNYVVLQDFQNFRLSDTDIDVLHSRADTISAWKDFSRVSAPVFEHNFTFKPCSGRLKTWDIKFSVETGTD